jgi:hypothetical protein
MKLGLLIIFAISLFDCPNNNVIAQKPVTEKWVDVNTKSDTLTFLTIGGHDYIQLDRGKEMRNGYLLPKSGAGPYRYKLLTDKISLYWTLSSDSNFYDYYFNRVDDTIVIENFYDPNLKGTRQTFKKLK